MNRTLTFLLASITAVTLSGCLGAPAGTPALGDTVAVDWAAFDLHTGAQVASGEELRFTLGSGQSGLGRDFERHLIGLTIGETFTFDSETDPSRPYGAIITTPRDQIDAGDAQAQVDHATFVQAIGQEPLVGEPFEFNVFRAEVLSIEDEIVTYRHHDHTAALDNLGILVNTHVSGEELHFDLQANPGIEFVVQDGGPFNQGAPLEGLIPGMYRTRDMTATHILYDFSGQVINADLDRPLRFEATVTEVVEAAPAEFSEDGFAARRSPVLLADPAAVTLVSGEAPEAAQPADGHDHTH